MTNFKYVPAVCQISNGHWEHSTFLPMCHFLTIRMTRISFLRRARGLTSGSISTSGRAEIMSTNSGIHTWGNHDSESNGVSFGVLYDFRPSSSEKR